MQDTFLLCQIVPGTITLQGYRVAEQYLIVALGVQDTPLRYIFRDFDDMNQVWLDLKGLPEAAIIQQLSQRPQGVQGPPKPRKPERAPERAEPTDVRTEFRPTRPRTDGPLPRPRKLQ